MIIRWLTLLFIPLFLYAFSACSEQEQPHDKPTVEYNNNNTTTVVQQNVEQKTADSIIKDKFPPVSGKDLLKCMPKIVGGAKIMTPTTGKSETEYGLETRADIEVLYADGVTARIAITDYADHYKTTRERYEIPYSEVGVEITNISIGNAKGFQAVNILEKTAVIRMALSERIGIDIEILKYTQDFGFPTKVVEMLDLQTLETLAQKK